jgi:putative toxin-antitoxin system antitoxin component (TIGR02293 family)
MDVSLARPALWSRAVQIFGSEQKAARWLRTRLSELNDRTPEEALGADASTEAVDAILDRIEYGVFR